MAVIHPFPRVETRFVRRRRPSVPSEPPAAPTATGPADRGTTSAPAPAGIPRDLVLDAAGRPRRAVLLAAVMIRRGRGVAEICDATGLPADVVTALSRTV